MQASLAMCGGSQPRNLPPFVSRQYPQPPATLSSTPIQHHKVELAGTWFRPSLRYMVVPPTCSQCCAQRRGVTYTLAYRAKLAKAPNPLRTQARHHSLADVRIRGWDVIRRSPSKSSCFTHHVSALQVTCNKSLCTFARRKQLPYTPNPLTKSRTTPWRGANSAL